jgi:hypothetical protein
MKQRYGIYVGALVAAVLTGCGGGDSKPASPVVVTPTPPVAVTPTPVVQPILVKSTSYGNAKDQGFSPVTLPADAAFSDAYAQADFKQNGNVMLFAATLKYDVKQPAANAVPSVFAFYSKTANGAWIKESAMIDTPTGCIHPRKAAVADFNNDGKPDVLVACHGYDAQPYVGEQNFLVLSTASGVYSSKAISSTPGFYHSATAADFNGDGKMDFLATDTTVNSKARMFLGNGDGTFKEDTKLPAALVGNYMFTVEATDVDSDGKIDLLLGADENPNMFSRSVVVAGNGTADFSAARVMNLPADYANGMPLDFLVKGNAVYVLRTSSEKNSFYNTKAIQKIENLLSEKPTSNVIYSVAGQGWVKWLIPTATGVVSDNATNAGGANF